jgi:23S rRNA (pseudouridine1915-N3)-methyltransferase
MPAFQVRIIAVGALKEDFWRRAAAEYSKRLERYCRLTIIEAKDLDAARCGGMAAARQKEAQSVIRLLGRAAGQTAGQVAAGQYYTVLLDSKGEQLDSEGFAGLVNDLKNRGVSRLEFVVGGSTGLDASLVPYAQRSLSFGRITLPHNLARIVLLEQLYRSFKIISHEPYHK